MTINFGVLIYENAQPMDVIGPWEVLATWQAILQAPINLYLIAETEGLIALDNNIMLKSHFTFQQSPPLDYLLVPGGRGRVQQVNNEKLIHYIQQQAKTCKIILSVCTGMFLLEKAGLLKDKSVTTYWRAIPELKAKDIRVVEERVVKNNHVWTSGGVTSGIDLALAFISEVAGKEVAGEVQFLLEYFPLQDLYCNAETVKSLPPYQGGAGVVEPQIPDYIKNYLKNRG